MKKDEKTNTLLNLIFGAWWGFNQVCRAAMLSALTLMLSGAYVGAWADENDRIRPWDANPRYWQYEGKPIMLLGGSWQDNLFNHPVGLERHLDLLQSVGGNYVRNTMSHRDAGNVFAYKQVDGKFDLDQWNEAYCLAEPGREYAVYFPDGGAVKLDASAATSPLQIRWLPIDRGVWEETQTLADGGVVELEAPGMGHWVALALAR